MKRAILAATALLSTTIMSTPAWADDTVLSPITNASDETPQQICEDVLRPAPESGFQTEPVNVNDPGFVNVGDPYFDPDPDTGSAGDPFGYGTPTASGLVFNGSYYRNGNSPNVWGGASATLTYPQTQQPWNLLQDQTDTITFGCHVWKYAGNPDTPAGLILVEPPGLQTTGNVVVDHQTNPAGVGNKITDDDFIVYGETVVTLICISPNNTTKTKPGTWTAKHGFLGSCTTASTLAGNLPIPSGNAPTSDVDTTYFPH